jgi:hypothetical protein
LEFETLEFVWDLGFGFWIFQSYPENHADFDASWRKDASILFSGTRVPTVARNSQ